MASAYAALLTLCREAAAPTGTTSHRWVTNASPLAGRTWFLGRRHECS